MHHVLNAICMYMPLNGASKKEILDDVKRKLKRRAGENINAEIRKALSAGLRSQIIEKQDGKYKLKISAIQDKFKDTDIIPIDDRRRPHCTMCGTKILLGRGQRRRLGATTVISRAFTVTNDEVGGVSSRKNATVAVLMDDKKNPSKNENTGLYSRRLKKVKSLTRRVRRQVYTEQNHACQQQDQQPQQQAWTAEKRTIVSPVSRMNDDMSDSNAIDEYNPKSYSQDDASPFRQRTNESHSDQFSYLQRSRSIFD